MQIKTIKYIMVHNGIFPSLRDKNAQIHPSMRIEDVKDGHTVKDDIETGHGIIIPLWYFGMDY